jgi:restriction system protein
MTEKNATKLYDDFLYQVALRTIHELFESDVANAIDFVVFNGFVNSINKATGQEQSACIATVQVDKTTFLALNLSAIDPKTCFKQLKGVSASTLSSLTPVAPLMRMDTSDKRFVDGKDVAQSINDSTNLAAMNWEDFEHLVRELFAKEFANNGSEVRVTRASRDGGVDAIAFDPDPIRGGKIVIQAKRYTNLVDVSAVRDLYGTVMNEGATKGILVTTSDFGPDAYAFATGKPISLLNGANLLHLLEKHGKRAYIDVKEAKILNAQQS